MAKRTKKHHADQKNKKGFDAAKTDSEFAHESGSHHVNELHHEKAKKEKAAKNQGQYKGMH
ncbi:hypothetical protein GKZ89_06845 [Bacillus mangrovi]|uniref:Uncharacterized protein n=1 Tax=Metabacillus mangrovi TaxID=1491830 RepID=A0A7X2S4J8_9BACI|nr:hypothetical protein [Metabacillus mangrovi]